MANPPASMDESSPITPYWKLFPWGFMSGTLAAFAGNFAGFCLGSIVVFNLPSFVDSMGTLYSMVCLVVSPCTPILFGFLTAILAPIAGRIFPRQAVFATILLGTFLGFLLGAATWLVLGPLSVAFGGTEWW